MADIASLVIQVDATGVASADRAMQGLGSTSSWLQAKFEQLATAWAALKLTEYAKDSIMLAARYETLGVAMQVIGNNAGYTGKQMEGFQAGLEKTGISMIEARNNLTRMAAAQLDLSKSSELARVAQDAAVVAGINSSEAFERLVQGIVSGQPRILHTMGIFADFSRAEKEWAADHGRSTESLSTAEKIQVRFNETLKEGATRAGAYEAAMGTAGKQIFSMERYVQDLQLLVGQVFGPVLTMAVFGLVEQLKDAKTWIEANQVTMQRMALTILSTTEQIEGMVVSFARLSNGAITVGNSLKGVQRIMEGIGFIAAAVSDTVTALTMAMRQNLINMSQDLEKVFNLASKVADKMPGQGQQSKVLGNISGMFGLGASQMQSDQDSQTGQTAVEKWMKDLEHNNLDQVTGQVHGLTAAQEAANIAAGNARRALEAQAAAQKMAADAAAEHIKQIQDFKEKLSDEVAQLGFTKEQQERYAAAKIGMSHADMVWAEGQIGVKEAYRVQQANLKMITKEELTLAEKRAQWSQEAQTARDRERAAVEADAQRVIDSVETPEEKRAREIQHVNDLYTAGMLPLEAYYRKLKELESQGTGTFATMVDAINSFSNAGATAFEKLAMTGKFSFKDMVNSMIQDLIRLQAEKAFQQLAGYLTSLAFAAFGSGGNYASGGLDNGSPGTSSGGLMGGTINGSPAASIVSAGAGKGSPAASVVVNVAVSSDGSSKVSSDSSGNEGKKLGDLVGNKVREVILKEMQPRGMLNPSRSY